MTVNTTERYSILRYRFENLPSSPLVVAVSFFGVLELKQYTGGTANGQFQTNGTPAVDTRMVAKMELLSDPTNSYYVNRSAGVPINGCVGFEFVQNVTVQEGDIMTITLDNQDLVQYSGDAGGVAVVCPRDSIPYLSQWVGVGFSHANTTWKRGRGVRKAAFRGYVENIYGLPKAEK